jgi:hypothetical protein
VHRPDDDPGLPIEFGPPGVPIATAHKGLSTTLGVHVRAGTPR